MRRLFLERIEYWLQEPIDEYYRVTLDQIHDFVASGEWTLGAAIINLVGTFISSADFDTTFPIAQDIIDHMTGEQKGE